MKKDNVIKVALVGNPNSGKPSLFNCLTGFKQQVGNFPGITVDKKSSTIKLNSEIKAEITDLPGTYSLYPNTVGEKIVLNVLSDIENKNFPEVVIYVADTTNISRHLLLLTQIMDLGIPVILALNRVDLAEDSGIICDESYLQKKLNIPVVKVNGRTGLGINRIKEILTSVSKPDIFFDIAKLFPDLVKEIKDLTGSSSDFKALLIAHHYKNNGATSFGREKVDAIVSKHNFSSIRAQIDEIMQRYEIIEPICKHAITKSDEVRKSITDKLDAIFTHRLYGSIIFFAVLFLIFQAIFAWAIYPMNLIDRGILSLNTFLNDTMPNGFITDLLTQGIITGLGGILIFVPQIAILFALIAVLEETGYMSRVVYLSDRVMQKFGLNGRSLVSLVSGAACAVPAIMSTRTINNWKERVITIFVTPFISCSARIPVMVVLISFAVPKHSLFGFISLQGLAMMSMYTLGAITAILSAFLLKKIIRSRESSFLMIELPVYQLPHWRNISISVLGKVKIFVVEAGKIIMVISIILWVLSSYGPKEDMLKAEEDAIELYNGTEMTTSGLDDLIASKKIEASYAGQIGKFMEPAIRPLGFDWKIGIALVTSFAAREVFVSTMATIYSVGSANDNETIVERMRKVKNPENNEPLFNTAVSFSLIVFYILAMQCMSTLAVVYRETKSWLIPLLQFMYMTGLAYVASWLTYSILS